MQVGSPQLPGYGGQAAKPITWQDSPYQGLIPIGNGNGNGAAPGPSIGAFQIPNNFFGFAMLMMGMR